MGLLLLVSGLINLALGQRPLLLAIPVAFLPDKINYEGSGKYKYIIDGIMMGSGTILLIQSLMTMMINQEKGSRYARSLECFAITSFIFLTGGVVGCFFMGNLYIQDLTSLNKTVSQKLNA